MVNGGDQRPPNNKESWEFKGNATIYPREEEGLIKGLTTILPQFSALMRPYFKGVDGIGGVGTVRFPKLMGCFVSFHV